MTWWMERFLFPSDWAWRMRIMRRGLPILEGIFYSAMVLFNVLYERERGERIRGVTNKS